MQLCCINNCEDKNVYMSPIQPYLYFYKHSCIAAAHTYVVLCCAVRPDMTNDPSTDQHTIIRSAGGDRSVQRQQKASLSYRTVAQNIIPFVMLLLYFLSHLNELIYGPSNRCPMATFSSSTSGCMKRFCLHITYI